MTLTQSILVRAAFDHDAHTAIAHKILALCGPVYGPLDALMKAQHDENARLTPLITRLVDEVEVLKAALEQYKTEPLTVRNQYERDWSDPLPPPTNQITTGPMYSRRYVANEALIAHQKRWEDLK